MGIFKIKIVKKSFKLAHFRNQVEKNTDRIYF